MELMDEEYAVKAVTQGCRNVAVRLRNGMPCAEYDVVLMEEAANAFAGCLYSDSNPMPPGSANRRTDVEHVMHWILCDAGMDITTDGNEPCAHSIMMNGFDPGRIDECLGKHMRYIEGLGRNERCRLIDGLR